MKDTATQAKTSHDTANSQPAAGPNAAAAAPPGYGIDFIDRNPQPNRTGLPDRLKAGVEALSGLSMDDVRVHYNSDKPAQLQALAYAQGTEIHVGPGQEKHLPHEAWHVVQQKEGRVRATMLMKDIAVNNDYGLEREADEMGAQALSGGDGGVNRELTQRVDADTQNEKLQINQLPNTKPIQRIIEDYKPGTIGSKFTVVKGLTDEQKTKIQELHNEKTTYTIDEARAMVGALPLNSGKVQSPTLPFPFRYDSSNDQQTMKTIANNGGGLVQYPTTGLNSIVGTSPQMSFSIGLDSSGFPTTSKRAITQSAVMDKISPNQAASALGFKCPTALSWEWLHLVAFSIGQTHVGELSAESKTLIKRTDQPQQIKENLVLGTAAANTEMLSYETQIKNLMKQHPTVKLNLVVIAHKEDKSVFGVTIPVAKRISYHFMFDKGGNVYSAPVILEFDTRSHDKPTTKSFETVVNELKEAFNNTTQQKEPIHGAITTNMDLV